VGRTAPPILLAICLAGLAASLAFSPLRPASARGAVPAEAADTPLPTGRLPEGAWHARRDARPTRRPTGHLIAYVRSAVTLRARPGGRVVERLSGETPFGSPRALAVVRSLHGRWLGVTIPELRNGRLGWVDTRAVRLRFARTRLELDVDLSQRLVVLRRGFRVLRRVSVGVGRPGSPTPTGRFAVTDKLAGSSYSASYGCCILALSATQPNVPTGWTGGNRIAIHGGPTGGAVSAGCIHAANADLSYLMRLVPLGTPVSIRA
jgi:L,D-transpeptidase catalytic domain